MAVEFDAATESHTGTTGDTTSTTMSWTHTPVGTPTGALIFIMMTGGSLGGQAQGTDAISGYSYGNQSYTQTLSQYQSYPYQQGSFGVQSFFVSAWFTPNPPAGAQTASVTFFTPRVSTAYGVAITVTSSLPTEMASPIVKSYSQSLAELSVSDYNSGTDSVRFAAIASDLAGIVTNPTSPGVNNLSNGPSSTWLHSIDLGSQVMGVVRETTAGQGPRNVGFSATTTEYQTSIGVAIREAIVPWVVGNPI